MRTLFKRIGLVAVVAEIVVLGNVQSTMAQQIETHCNTTNVQNQIELTVLYTGNIASNRKYVFSVVSNNNQFNMLTSNNLTPRTAGGNNYTVDAWLYTMKNHPQALLGQYTVTLNYATGGQVTNSVNFNCQH